MFWVFLLFFLLAGASHQPQLDLSCVVKGSFKMVLLCPSSPRLVVRSSFPCFPRGTPERLSPVSVAGVTSPPLHSGPNSYAGTMVTMEYGVTWLKPESFFPLQLRPTCVSVGVCVRPSWLVTSRWHCSQVVTVCSHQFHLPAPAAKGKSANVFVSSWL